MKSHGIPSNVFQSLYQSFVFFWLRCCAHHIFCSKCWTGPFLPFSFVVHTSQPSPTLLKSSTASDTLQSSTCIPLPPSHSLPLILLPLAHPNICSQPSERFELRTKSFGRDSCNVSTLMVLTAVVAALCGVAAVFLAWAIWRVGSGAWRGWREASARDGTELVVGERGERTWQPWERSGGKGWRGFAGTWWWWLKRGEVEGRVERENEEADAERRALLGRQER